FGLSKALLRGSADPDTASLTALIAAVFLASELGVVAEAHIAKTDAALLAMVVLGQGALGLAYIRARAGLAVGWGVAALFWLAAPAAILLKGPVGLAVAASTAATLAISDRDLAWLRGLRIVPGLVFMAAAITPWLLAIQTATEGRFLSESLGQDLWSKLIDAQEAHGAPPFFYVVLAFFSFLPVSLFLAPAWIRGCRHHDLPLVRFLLAWIVPAWVFVELVPTKLPHYVLPLYPALALLAAGALVDGVRPEEAVWSRRTTAAVTALWAAVTLVYAAALVVLPLRFGDGLSATGLLATVVMLGLMIGLFGARRAPLTAAALVAAWSPALVVPAAAIVLPGLDRLWLSREAAALVAETPPTPGRPLVVVGYNEPSLVFLLGTSLRTATAGSAAAVLAGG